MILENYLKDYYQHKENNLIEPNPPKPTFSDCYTGVPITELLLTKWFKLEYGWKYEQR